MQDTGAGIPREKTALIFQPFQQASSEHQREGTGLGLSISKRLIEMMNGSIHFTTPTRARLQILVRFAGAPARAQPGPKRFRSRAKFMQL